MTTPTNGEVEYKEPGRLKAGLFALVVHVLFFGLLFMGLTWRSKPPESMTVDLWDSLPPPPQAAPRPAPPEPEAIRQETPPQAVKKEIEVQPPKPDIQLKEKLEKERRKKEEAAKEAALKEEEKKRTEKEREKEKQKLVEQKAKEQVLKEQKQREAEASKIEQEQLALARQMQAQQTSAQARLIDEYKAQIINKIRRNIVEPPGLTGNPQAEYEVVLLPGGDVLSVKLRVSSNIAAYDAAVERAILKSQPLPLPPDPALFRDFRQLMLKFRLYE